MRPLAKATLAIAFACSVSLSGCVALSVKESDIIPSFGIGQLPSILPAGFSVEEHRFERPDGSSVYGLALVSSSEAPTLLYYGGNQQSVDGTINTLARQYPEMGLNVYYFDRRGQGRNAGSPGVATAGDDARLVYEYVRENVEGPLILLGFSLGGFETTEVISRKPADAVILAATATNVDDFVKTALPWYMNPFVSVEVDDALRGIDNASNLAAYHGPTLLLAGAADEQTSPKLMKKLYEASPSNHRRLVIVDGASHNSLLRMEQTVQIIRVFLTDSDLLPANVEKNPLRIQDTHDL